MNLILVRHGEIDANCERRYAGRAEDELNERGWLQAHEAAREIKAFRPQQLFCGPLTRVKQTAAEISRATGVIPVVVGAFDELLMGPWEGLTEDEVAQRFPTEWRLWNTAPSRLIVPGRESLRELQNRAVAGLEDIRKKVDRDARVCVVSHVAVIRVLLLHFRGGDLDSYRGVDVPNAKPIPIFGAECSAPP